MIRSCLTRHLPLRVFSSQTAVAYSKLQVRSLSGDKTGTKLHHSTMAAPGAKPDQFTITLLGDIMLGRLVDQLLPTHVDEPEEAKIVTGFRQRHPDLHDYTYETPWGNALSLLARSDLVLGNLETSATTHDIRWPDKVFNYRMHPDNVKCLTAAGINHVSLANNHTLDFSKEGLFETIQTLRTSNIAFAGAGETPLEAEKPAELVLKSQQPQQQQQQHDQQNEPPSPIPYKVHVYAFSDHPSDWRSVPEFNLLEYTPTFKLNLKRLLCSTATATAKPALKIVSIHWGPNYQWQPDDHIREMAHYLLDHCDVDLIWGHSSHHIQGVEIWNGKLIVYGCGDFVDDYAVNREYRNDLSAAWVVKLETTPNTDRNAGGVQEEEGLKVVRLEVWPNRIKQFQASLLDRKDADHEWVTKKFRSLCKGLGTHVEEDLGEEGQIIVDLARQ